MVIKTFAQYIAADSPNTRNFTAKAEIWNTGFFHSFTLGRKFPVSPQRGVHLCQPSYQLRDTWWIKLEDWKKQMATNPSSK